MILSDEPGYDDARGVFNAMVDRRPAAVLQCGDADDVARGIEFARAEGLVLSVKSGGHAVSGSAVSDAGLMLDMSGLTAVRVDPEQRVAVAEGGATLGHFDAATAVHGLATTLGVVSLTGIAGLTLGGGIGWLNGKHGLACDNVLSFDVVTAEGRLRTVDATHDQDLFWALRGGGGNFGVVTSFRYQLHPVDAVLAGGIVWAPAAASAALTACHELARQAPDELAVAASVWPDADGVPTASVGICWSGEPADGDRVLAPLRAVGPPVLDSVAQVPYVSLQASRDGGFPEGRQHYWKAAFLPELSDAAIETVLEFVGRVPSPHTGVGFQQMTGAAARVAPDATAFAHRGRHYDFLILSQWDDPADSSANIAWTRDLFAAMQPFLSRGAYVNNLGADDTDRTREAYGLNYERLARIKAVHDPQNLFRSNQNIGPASSIQP